MIHIFYVCFLIGFIYNFCAFSSILTAMQFSLRHGFMSGFYAGLGSAAAQAIWIAIAIGAISVGSDLLQAEVDRYKFIAAILLFVLAARLLISPLVSTKQTHKYKFSGHISGFLTVFAVAISAPGRIIGYSALLLVMGIPITSGEMGVKALICISTIIGVIAWWFTFSISVWGFKMRVTPDQAIWMQRITAVLLMILAVAFLLAPSLNFL